MTEEQIAAAEYEEAEAFFRHRERHARFVDFVANGGLVRLMNDEVEA